MTLCKLYFLGFLAFLCMPWTADSSRLMDRTFSKGICDYESPRRDQNCINICRSIEKKVEIYAIQMCAYEILDKNINENFGRQSGGSERTRGT